MKVTVIECEQRDEVWRAARCGRLTGSLAAAVISKGRSAGKESEKRATARNIILSERLTGEQAQDDFDTRALARGRDKEPLARGVWEAITGQIIQTTGFISCDEIMAGCSLDGHVGDFDGVLELKAPDAKKHLEYMKGEVVPEDYLPQLRHNVWVTGAQWGEFCSFDDRYKDEALQLFRVRMSRAELQIDEYEAGALKFLAEVAADHERVKAKKAAA